MDDNNEMDLALNGDFDSELFDCWDTAAEQDHEPAGTNAAHTLRESIDQERTSQANVHRQSRISYTNDGLQHAKPSTSKYLWVAGSDSSSMQQPGATSDHMMMFPGMSSEANAQQYQGATTVSVSDAGSSSTTSSFQQMLSSIANMPLSHHQRSMDPRAILSSANCPPHGAAGPSAENADLSSISHDDSSMSQQQQSQFDLTSAALLPLAMNALAAGVTLPLPLVLQAAQQALHFKNTAQQQTQNLQQQCTYPVPASRAQQQATGSPAPYTFTKPAAVAATHIASQNTATNNFSNPLAPLFSVDASAELRANFLSSQQTAGVTGTPSQMLQDFQQYPFGIAVNGFHPQHNMGLPQPLLGNLRMANTKNNTKNVKEQRRAQKITTLIENLRMKMEKDGWQVGLNKSKFNTLSCCADYIRHLVKINEDKEATVKKTQCDLEAERKKLEDVKNQSDRSEPESTTSSLTVSSGSASAHEKKNDQDSDSTPSAACSDDKKRHASACDAELNHSEHKHQAKRLRYQESSTSTGTSSNGSDPDDTVKMRNMESVSDLTDSNKGSTGGSNSGSGSDEAASEQVQECSNDDNNENYSDDEASDAAVAKRKAEEQREYSNRHVHKRKHMTSAELSLARQGFDLDFKEVFINSNIPQLLATTDGRILAWNDFFLRATGFNEETIKKATIFGLVKCSKLANLFEIVAKALRNKSQPVGNYLATTLPCIKFHACDQRQLYITVTFMSDVDPRKRCFHCVLTDSPPTTESPGPVTESLLLMLLSVDGETHLPVLTKKMNDATQEADNSETGFEGGSCSDRADQEAAEDDEEEGTAEDEPYSFQDDVGDCDTADEIDSVERA
ncbi:hypothetical protein MPSEU_000253100 [Mayamaea pseudoterrestris]|nr:hypothetical protein MPSEU_000253100 [Mayamaea pseudoterrestris]